ncbi:HU family DNA-binding protein [Alkalispirillum mobile]|nr:HU family DNA-binding protein [Alkalispirillum mobile]
MSVGTESKRKREMNKSELIEAVAQSADISKAAASKAVDSMVDCVTNALKEGDQVTLVGFGTFQVRERAARTGRNPRTGETIEIAASKVPSFKAGKALKDAVN